MSEQENLCETLNLSVTKNEIIRANFDSSVNLKEDQNLLCHESLSNLLPNEVSSAEDTTDYSSSADDDSDSTESDEDDEDSGSYKTPSLKSSESDLHVSLSNSDSEAPITNFNKLTIKENTTNTKVKGDMKIKGRPSSCIFVASLAATLTDDELCHSVTQRFKDFGNLNGVKVLRDTQNRPYAFVQYCNDHDAQRALNLSQGTLLNDRIIRCEQARVNRTLYISCKTRISCREIEIFCEKFGELEQLVPSLNPCPSDSNSSNHPKKQLLPNFKLIDPSTYKIESWFAQFAYRDDAIRAFANIKSELNWTVHWVQNVRVPKRYNLLSSSRKQMQDFQSKQTAYQETSDELSDPKISIDRKSVFVGQLHKDTTTELLTDHFKTYGSIFNLKLFHKPTTIFAFIEYDDESSAAAALEKENHSTFLGKTIHVQYKEINNYGRYVRRETRLVHRDDSYSRSHNTNFYVSPQITFAPPPINITKHKNHGSASIGTEPGVYVDPIAKGDYNLRRNSLPVHYTPLVSKWGPVKPVKVDESIRNEENITVEKPETYNDDDSEEEEDVAEDVDSSDETSSDTLQSGCDTADLIDDQSHISMTSYNGSSRGSSKYSKANNYTHGKYDSNDKAFSYKPRRYSHPPNPYYQPNYFVGYPGLQQSNNQALLMYYPPLPMPPPEALNQSPYYQPNHHVQPYGTNMIPMMMPHGRVPPPPPIPTLPQQHQHLLPPLSPNGMPASLNFTNSSQDNCEFNFNFQRNNKGNSNHVSFEEDDHSGSSGNYTDSDVGISKNNRFQDLLRNQVPSFKPNSCMVNESDGYDGNDTPEYLDY